MSNDQIPPAGPHCNVARVSHDQVIVQMDGFLSFELQALEVVILVCGAQVSNSGATCNVTRKVGKSGCTCCGVGSRGCFCRWGNSSCNKLNTLRLYHFILYIDLVRCGDIAQPWFWFLASSTKSPVRILVTEEYCY